MKAKVEDGFLASRVIDQQWGNGVREHAETIIKYIVSGHEQYLTGKLGSDCVEASEYYLLFSTYLVTTQGYMGPKAIETKAVLFDLMTFSGEYLKFWEWYRDWTITELSSQNYEKIAI